jgi:hypothetical protein
MAFEVPVFYGLRVDSNLSDVIDQTQALLNINLNPQDLDIIRGSASVDGATRFDLQAISRLQGNIYETIDRLRADTSQYDGLLEESPGTDITLRGNLNVNGGVGGSAIRYRDVNETNDGIDILDISTSRISSWSTVTNPPADTDPIFYGAEVKVISGGKLVVDNLRFGVRAEERLFDSEIPTHKIKVTLDGEEYEMLAMKGIPLRFRGYFRRFDGQIQFTNINGLRSSWRVVNINDPIDVQSFENIGQLTSAELNYRSVNAAERDIEIYYPPDNLTVLSLPNVTMEDLPSTTLPSLNVLDIRFNDFKEMPDISTFAPTLNQLDISRNPLYLSGDEGLRKFSSAVASRIPSTVSQLAMHGTFFGSIESEMNSSGFTSVIEERLPNLTVLNLSRSGGAYFGPDNNDPDGYLPTVPDTCQEYLVEGNDFRSIPPNGVLQLPNLIRFDVSGNGGLSDPDFETIGLASDTIQTVDISNTNLRLPNLQNKTELSSLSLTDTASASFYTNDTQEGTYKLLGCPSLSSLNISGSGVSGFIPKFKGNSGLRSFSATPASGLTGGRPPNGEHGYPNGDEFVLFRDTFNDCRSTLTSFSVRSDNLLSEKGFEDGTFRNMSSLRTLYWESGGRTGGDDPTITLPDMSSCPSLREFSLPNNNFSGPVPQFTTNDQISSIDLSGNRLSGGVPEYSNRLNLRLINLSNNELSNFVGFNSLPALQYLYLQNNSQLSGSIPNLTDSSSSLRRVYLYNCSFNGYTVGSFVGLTSIQRIDIANNDLTETDLNSIITDLHTLYERTRITRVYVNLRGQSGAPNYNPRSTLDGGNNIENTIRTYIENLRSGGWSIIGVDG